MESRRFDHLTRLLASGATRRRTIRVAVAALAGATITEPAGAATRCRRGHQTCQRNAQCCSGSCLTGRDYPVRVRNRCTCEQGLQGCGNACVDTATDMRHCGGCGNACAAGDHCVDGSCRIHQQCYSDDSGLCIMTPLGKEYRVEGAYLPEETIGHGWTSCTTNAQCAGAYAVCDVPGVSCVCVRGIDSGEGYQDAASPGNGICVPLLGDGDGEITCQASGSDRCVFTADGAEVKACYGRYADAAPCLDFRCDGVGLCAYEGISCLCAMAIKDHPLPFYTNITWTPYCWIYSPEDGLCVA